MSHTPVLVSCVPLVTPAIQAASALASARRLISAFATYAVSYTHLLQVGDSLHIHIPEADNTENILPVRMDLSILYEDEDILVINKAADMPVHPSIGNYDNTLANGCLLYTSRCV